VPYSSKDKDLGQSRGRLQGTFSTRVFALVSPMVPLKNRIQFHDEGDEEAPIRPEVYQREARGRSLAADTRSRQARSITGLESGT
jgi:hypothetical protein